MRRGAEAFKIEPMNVKQTQKETPRSAQREVHENVFANAKLMILSAVGKLPTALVVILLVSMAMAAITGIILQFNSTPGRVIEFMPLRLAPSQDAVMVDPRKIQGGWVYQTPDYAMALTLVGDRFEWIITFADVQEAQFYARGNFRIDGDVMILGIRPDLGIPFDPSKPWVKFLPIAMKDINTKFKIQTRQMIWDVPTSEQNRIVAQSGRIFTGHEDGHIEWTRQ